MKKVFIIHGLGWSPNGGWRPRLMAELAKRGTYACALAMPFPEHPVCAEWVDEITRQLARVKTDELFLVGHSLGVPAILRYLERPDAQRIAGAVLVSGPVELTENDEVNLFLKPPFDYGKISSTCGRFAVIHGEDDPLVPVSDARTLARELRSPLIIVKNGGYLNGAAGWLELPQCLEALDGMTG